MFFVKNNLFAFCEKSFQASRPTDFRGVQINEFVEVLTRLGGHTSLSAAGVPSNLFVIRINCLANVLFEVLTRIVVNPSVTASSQPPGIRSEECRMYI